MTYSLLKLNQGKMGNEYPAITSVIQILGAQSLP